MFFGGTNKKMKKEYQLNGKTHCSQIELDERKQMNSLYETTTVGKSKKTNMSDHGRKLNTTEHIIYTNPRLYPFSFLIDVHPWLDLRSPQASWQSYPVTVISSQYIENTCQAFELFKA